MSNRAERRKGEAMADFSAVQARLEARLDELTSRIQQLNGDLRQPLDADFEEQAVDLEDHETMEALENASRQEAEQIRAALARIEDGSYGVCGKCGEDIAPRRLEAVPTATLCIKCAK